MLGSKSDIERRSNGNTNLTQIHRRNTTPDCSRISPVSVASVVCGFLMDECSTQRYIKIRLTKIFRKRNSQIFLRKIFFLSPPKTSPYPCLVLPYLFTNLPSPWPSPHLIPPLTLALPSPQPHPAPQPTPNLKPPLTSTPHLNPTPNLNPPLNSPQFSKKFRHYWLSCGTYHMLTHKIPINPIENPFNPTLSN
jgi:hypothetical protein